MLFAYYPVLPTFEPTCCAHSEETIGKDLCKLWNVYERRDINCNKVGFGAERWDRKPLRTSDWVQDISAVSVATQCVKIELNIVVLG